MSDLEPKQPGENCNARRTDGSGYCGQPAGWGTDHSGHGRCKFHGGNTPNQEKSIIDELEDAGEDAAVSYRLIMKHIRQQVESGDLEDVDLQQLDRLARSAWDRAGYGPTETQELEHSGEDGGPLTIRREVVNVDGDE